VLIHGPGPQSGEDVIIQELFAQVFDNDFGRAGLWAFSTKGVNVITLAGRRQSWQ